MPGTKEHARHDPSEAQDDADHEAPLPPPRTRVGEVLAQSRETGKFLASLNVRESQSLVMLIVVLFICGTLGFLVYRTNEQAKDDKTAIFRYSESQSELQRQATRQDLTELKGMFTKESTDLRTYFADQDKRRDDREASRDERRMKFEAEERQKDRAALTTLLNEQARWRELLRPLLGKNNAGCEGDDGPDAVPAPKTKTPR